MPEITPVSLLRVSPAGYPLHLQTNGGVPVASSVAEYACPTVPPGRLVVVTFGASAAITSVYIFLSLPPALDAVTITLPVNASSGVPLNTPPENVIPFGRSPVMSQLSGVPSLVLSVTLYALLYLPFLREFVDIFGGVTFTTRSTLFVSEPYEFSATT